MFLPQLCWKGPLGLHYNCHVFWLYFKKLKKKILAGHSSAHNVNLYLKTKYICGLKREY